jgi:hypothetical protein
VLKYFRINNFKHYVAYDYQSNNILYVVKSNKSNLINWILLLEHVLTTYGVPEYLYDNGFFTHNKSFSNDVCSKLKIKKVDRLKTGNIKIKLFKYKEKRLNIRYKGNSIPAITLHLKKEATTIKNNIIQFKNNRYSIISDINIKKRKKVIIYYTWDYTNLLVGYNNKLYNTLLLEKVASSKGKSKYW